jgi:putative MATE family efflux protein
MSEENQAVKSRSNSKSSVPITLDRLDWGSEESMKAEFSKTRKQRKELPETITSKELYADIIRIAWPSLCELFLTSLVSMVDTMMVGGLGAGAISAVSLATQPKFVFMNLIMALNTGATALVSRARGMQNRERADSILRQSLILITIVGIISSAVGYCGSEWMIRFMSNGGLAEDVIAEGTRYLRIQFLFFMSLSWSMSISAILKGTGQAKPSMVYNTISNLVNIFLNWVMIYGNLGCPRLGVAGASIATGIGQSVATIIAFGCILSGKYYATLHLSIKTLFKFDRDILTGLYKVGTPAMIEQLIMRVGMILFSRTVASLGNIEFATHNIAMNIQSMSFMIGQGFAVSSTSLVGQGLGKKRPDMSEHYSRRCRSMGLWVSVGIAAIFLIFRHTLVGLYNKDSQILELGGYLMFFVAFLQPFQSNQFILGGSLRGAGDTKFTAFVMLITTVIIRTSLAWLFVTVLGYGVIGAWVAVATDQIIRSLLIMWRYNQGKWKAIRL